MSRGRGKSNAGQNAALMGGAAMSGAGSGVICLPGDNSFVCQMKRVVGTVQGVVFLLFVLFLVYYVWNNRKNIFGK